MTNQDYYESYLLERIAEAPFYKRLAEIYVHRAPAPVVIGKMHVSQDMLERFEKEMSDYEIKEDEQ